MIYYPRCHAVLSVYFDGFGGPAGDKPSIVDVLPRSATVHFNGYKEADTWDLEFDSRSLPVGPEQVRSMEARIWMFAADGLDDPREKYLTDEHRMVKGLADNVEVAWSQDGTSLRIEGRDYTALLLDRPWDPTRRLPIGKPLDELVHDLANEVSTFTVEFDAIDGRDQPVSPPVVTTAQMYKTRKRGQQVKSGTSYWDVVYGLCLSHGFIAFVDGSKVVITTSRTRSQRAKAGPYRVAYGRNLSDLTVSRKLGKEQVPQVVASAYRPDTRETVQVVFPEKAEDVKTGLGTKRDERVFVTPPWGVWREEELRRYAEAYYYDIARGETTWKFATHWLTDLPDGAGSTRDLLKLRAGDAVAVDWDPLNSEDMRALSNGQRFEHMVKLGYHPRVARAVADNYDLVVRDWRDAPVYAREVTASYSEGDGIEVSVEGINFVAPRRDEKRR